MSFFFACLPPCLNGVSRCLLGCFLFGWLQFLFCVVGEYVRSGKVEVAAARFDKVNARSSRRYILIVVVNAVVVTLADFMKTYFRFLGLFPPLLSPTLPRGGGKALYRPRSTYISVGGRHQLLVGGADDDGVVHDDRAARRRERASSVSEKEGSPRGLAVVVVVGPYAVSSM